jgi:hypothetical protein
MSSRTYNVNYYIYAFRDEIVIFIEKENGPEAEKFRDDFCVVKLSYLVDIFEKLNFLKLQLQGANIHTYVGYECSS